MNELPVFLSANGLPRTEVDIIATLQSDKVMEVRNFVLGPGMTSNIPQACQRWLERTGLVGKGTLVTGRVPDEYLVTAQAVIEPGVVPLYWTCAVFGREKDLFFGLGTNTMMFFVQEVMLLDHMQLATTSDRLSIDGAVGTIVNDLLLPPEWKGIASHPSPAPLLDELLSRNSHVKWVEATSNGAAAEMCLAGECDACITTETARIDVGLGQIHDFGCPDMVFFGGLTEHGAGVVRCAWAAVQESRLGVPA